MVSCEFADRFLDPTYANNEPVQLFVPGGADRWVPERLWWRLVALATAYEVHLLPHLPGTTEAQFLNAQQVSYRPYGDRWPHSQLPEMTAAYHCSRQNVRA